MRTNFPKELDGASSFSQFLHTEVPPASPETTAREPRFPMKVRFRSSVVKIYSKTKGFPFYRLAYRSEGRRVICTFKTLAEAKTAAESKARALHSGNQVGASLPKAAAQVYRSATDKLAELSRDLTAGNDPTAPAVTVSLEEAIGEYIEAKRLLGLRRLTEAVTGFLGTVAQVRRVKIRAAVDEYQKERKLLTVPASEGKRPALSPKFHYQDERRLDRFAQALLIEVADLTKDHFDIFFREHLAELGAKSRNHYRGTLRQWLAFCVARDYLPAGHRLLEARALQNEKADGGDVEIYTPKEFSALVSHAENTLQPALVIGALAGLRTQELLRLEWSDVWRRAGYIEITRGKAKTRQRRLVPLCPALVAWLQPYRHLHEGRVWEGKECQFHKLFRDAGEAAGIARKDNALRHSFISYRLAEVQNEQQVAAEAGTSPTMIHGHYREVVTPVEAKEWFNILPDGSVKNLVPNPATKREAKNAVA